MITGTSGRERRAKVAAEVLADEIGDVWHIVDDEDQRAQFGDSQTAAWRSA